MDAAPSPHQVLARKLGDSFCTFPNVEAIALAGSQTAGSIDSHSDIDLYIAKNHPVLRRVIPA